ncbi:hypothetical protein [Vibrio gazogenes]|uniref:Uncharacterized protein n=1 Tax=Vibrio gazogenes TaxID=687 RepID=A0A1Z2SBN0_VIBGA|nr:hypothetical protein [Vibrio gazogenes]ASA54584.1 hypothetical protein BSQ33_01785 [Vibrio gazogenes]
MKEKIYDEDNIAIFKNDGKYYIRYDAGAHQVAIREDEINEEEASMIINDRSKLMKVLRSLQEHLIKKGEKPYISNV